MHAHVLHSRVQACCILHMGCTCIVSYPFVGLRGSDLIHMCGIIHSESMSACVCVCVLICLTVIISTSVFDGSLHTDHMDAYICKYLMSSVYVYANSPKFVCVCVCVCPGCCICAFAIYFSEWVAKYSNASCVTVCERGRNGTGLWVCVLFL